MHRKLNSMSAVVVDGVRHDTLPHKKSAIFGFYKSIFSKFEPWRPKLTDYLCYGTLTRSLLRCLSVRKKLLKLF